MTMHNIKPGAFKRPGKVKSRAKPVTLTPRQREIHCRIEAQREHSMNPPRRWHPEEYPHLYALLESAKREARSRQKLKGRIVFTHEGRRYAARFTNLDRIIVEDSQTGRFIASSGYFAL
jgi:hypothetical protein